jgi:hypothetical protein
MKTESKLVKSQYKTFEKDIMVDNKEGKIKIKIRYDDECGNGHNSFAITGSIYSSRNSTLDRYFVTIQDMFMLIPMYIFAEEKPYTYLGNIKSDTLVHGWHFVFNDKFYVATYNQFHGCSSRVSVYNSDKKANFDCVKPIEEYVMYCDIETVADIFCAKVLREEVAPSAIE